MQKKTSIKLLSILIATLMLLSVIPVMVFADDNNVYISVSYDQKYVNDQNGDPIAYVTVSFDDISSVDLNEYGLSDYLYDEDGDGKYETTALHLVIWAHENLYGGSWDNVRFSGAPGSSYFEGGIFGFDENLNYYLNGEYPLAREGWGATSDNIVLEAGDYINIGSFTSWDFYTDSNYGFHFFADEDGTFTHDYTAEEESALPIKIVRSYSAMGVEPAVYDEPDYTVYYGKSYGNETGTVTTDGSGCAEITFPEAGTWYLWADGGYGCEFPDAIVSTPAFAKVTVTAKEAEQPQEPEQPRQPQDVSDILDATMAKLAETVTEPVFGTTAGEWTVFSLARGGHFEKGNEYFEEYYDRIVETVNTKAAEVKAEINLDGALHKNKSTENSRLIVALSAIGKNATSVGKWNLITPYEDFDWIKNQGLNGTIWALIALDSNDYATTDTTIRQQCVDAILAAQHDDGGWVLTANKANPSDPDITGMALTALYPYRDQAAVAAACAEAIKCLSAMQHDNGTFESGGSECSESCAWAIIGTTAWGINPDTDARFIKNGNSAVDGLLAHYVEEENMFQHIIGAGTNAMGTDQGCYGLIAYNRFINGEKALYDFSDVTFDAIEEDPEEPTEGIAASLGLPTQINSGDKFNGTISVDNWDNDAGYKMIDFMMSVPAGIAVKDVVASETLAGGELDWNLEAETGRLRGVYFDANENETITIEGTTFPAELFTITFEATNVAANSNLEIALAGMSAKKTSVSTDESAMTVIGTENATGNIDVVLGISFSAKELYRGDDVDLIPADKKAVAVAVTGLASPVAMKFDDVDFIHSPEITAKTLVNTYVAIVDAQTDMEKFVDEKNFEFGTESAAQIKFGDANNDAIINAEDALSAVDAWLRKDKVETDKDILVLNVNGDSRINTFDALGIVENFVNGSEYTVVTNAATLNTTQTNQ